MHALWVTHRRAIVSFAAICVGIVAFPATIATMAEYYATKPVIIPVWFRTLMLMGAFVRRLDLAIALAAAVFLFARSASAGRSQH